MLQLAACTRIIAQCCRHPQSMYTFSHNKPLFRHQASPLATKSYPLQIHSTARLKQIASFRAFRCNSCMQPSLLFRLDTSLTDCVKSYFVAMRWCAHTKHFTLQYVPQGSEFIPFPDTLESQWKMRLAAFFVLCCADKLLGVWNRRLYMRVLIRLGGKQFIHEGVCYWKNYLTLGLTQDSQTCTVQRGDIWANSEHRRLKFVCKMWVELS